MGERSLQKIGGIPVGTGLVQGIVIDNVDTDTPSRGRCKVWFPLLHGPVEPLPSDLPFAENGLLFGGLANTGLVIIPELRASVYCGFELGYIEKPVMLAFWYGEEGLPDQHPTGETRDKVLTLQRTDSESGDRFLLQIDFTQNSIKVTRTTDDGDDFLQLNQDGIKAQLNDESSIEINREGNVVVNAKGNAEVSAQGDVTLGGGGLQATGKVVTTEHIDPFTGAPHPQGSVNVKASL